MTSAERIVEYSELNPEEDEGSEEDLPKHWPKYGLITAEGASFAHHGSLPYVLKNLCFSIQGNHKVQKVTFQLYNPNQDFFRLSYGLLR